MKSHPKLPAIVRWVRRDALALLLVTGGALSAAVVAGCPSVHQGGGNDPVELWEVFLYADVYHLERTRCCLVAQLEAHPDLIPDPAGAGQATDFQATFRGMYFLLADEYKLVHGHLPAGGAGYELGQAPSIIHLVAAIDELQAELEACLDALPAEPAARLEHLANQANREGARQVADRAERCIRENVLDALDGRQQGPPGSCS